MNFEEGKNVADMIVNEMENFREQFNETQYSNTQAKLLYMLWTEKNMTLEEAKKISGVLMEAAYRENGAFWTDEMKQLRFKQST